MADNDRVSTSFLEYVGFAMLFGWGVFCVSLNYFLWFFRYIIEISGFAPSSWDPPNPPWSQPKKA